MNKIIAAFLCIVILSVNMQAQDNKNKNDNEEKVKGGFALGFVPQYTIVNGLRVDADIRTGSNSNDWLLLSPQVYYHQDNNQSQDYESMSGYGIDFHYRHYLNQDSEVNGLHFDVGFSFQYFLVEEYDLVKEEFTENGNNYFMYVNKLVEYDFYKLGPDIQLGYQFNIKQKLYLDLYAGPAFRKSFDHQEGRILESYNNWWGDFGYSGIILNAGLRLGIIF